jgi:hypothetical protein
VFGEYLLRWHHEWQQIFVRITTVDWCSQSSHSVTVNRLNAFTVPLLPEPRAGKDITSASAIVSGMEYVEGVTRLKDGMILR